VYCILQDGGCNGEAFGVLLLLRQIRVMGSGYGLGA